MIQDKLKTWSYYYDKLPLYFKNDDRIAEHFHAIFDLLVQADFVEDEILTGFDVMDSDYLTWLNSMDDSVNKDKSDILEKIAAIYGVTRDFSLEVEGTTKQLHLNNAELLTLVQARIIQMNYDGTFIMAKNFYEDVNLNVMLYTSDGSAEAKAYLIDDGTLSNNFINMFKAGLFNIVSMGITYKNYYIKDLDSLFMFDMADGHRFDVGLWL